MAHHVEQFTLITQNVDGLHQKAGSTGVIELHGNITRTRCFDEDVIVTAWEYTREAPPRCPRCGGLLRPDVVWFEEELPKEALEAATAASDACDMFLCIGTSAVVHPAASLPLRALAAGATLVVVNPNETPLSAKAHYVVKANAGEVVPELVKCLAKSSAVV
jgi:NAD-dependent deacetylase